MVYSNCEWSIAVYNIHSTALAFQPPNDAVAACFQGSICELYVEFTNTEKSKLCEILSLPTRWLAGIKRVFLCDCLCEKSCKQLTNLVAKSFLRLNGLIIRCCDVDNFADLLEALRATNITQVLQLSDFQQISNSSIEQLSKLVYTSSALSYCCLQNIYLTEGQNLQLLFSAMAKPSALVEVGLYNVYLSPSDMEYLSVVLSQNSKLTELSLFECSIDDDGAFHIATALEENTTLKVLWFRNQITIAGAQALADMLRINSTLKELHVLDRSIGIDGAIKLITSLEENGSLVQLELCEDCHPPELRNIMRVKFVSCTKDTAYNIIIILISNA